MRELLMQATSGAMSPTEMPKVDRAWCPYCVLDALTHFATFALTLPEARKAIAGRQAIPGWQWHAP
jgi:hypothetical protein